MHRYPLLPDHIRTALAKIEPSRDGNVSYNPCSVLLRDSQVLPAVYVISEEPYLKHWGIYPENDKGKSWIRIEDVIGVEESPLRLPARFANELYKQGESGMGYTVFTIVFGDGQEQPCITGNAVDFIRYPIGKGPDDVVAVRPHQGAGMIPQRARLTGIGASTVNDQHSSSSP